MSKPIVFNYKEYARARAENEELKNEIRRLRERIANLEIRCRIAEEEEARREPDE